MERVQSVLAHGNNRGLSVKQVQLNDGIYVVVWGAEPDASLRHELADALYFGLRTRLTKDQLCQIIGETAYVEG